MVDALASGASTGNGVEVRVLSWAPTLRRNSLIITYYSTLIGSHARLCITNCSKTTQPRGCMCEGLKMFTKEVVNPCLGAELQCVR